jgi:hypothetical protein
MTEPGRDGVNGHASLEALRGPVGPQRMRVRELVGDARGRAATAHKPMNGDRGEGERRLVAVAAKADKQGLLVKQSDAAGERVDRRPRLQRRLHGLRDGDLALASARGAASKRGKDKRPHRRPMTYADCVYTRSSNGSRTPTATRSRPSDSRSRCSSAAPTLQPTATGRPFGDRRPDTNQHPATPPLRPTRPNDHRPRHPPQPRRLKLDSSLPASPGQAS